MAWVLSRADDLNEHDHLRIRRFDLEPYRVVTRGDVLLMIEPINGGETFKLPASQTVWVPLRPIDAFTYVAAQAH